MHTIETIGVVTPDHQLMVQSVVPNEIGAGEHKVVLTIGETEPQQRGTPFFRPPYSIDLIDPSSTFQREDIYDDVDR